MAMAIYRKYRPSSFEELLGQEIIVKILKEAAGQDRLSHAYLFSGPRGTGKTTTARLIAKIANCEGRKNDTKFRSEGEPCNKCTACTSIDAGRSLDIYEIDAASNRGIDEIRNLKENIRLAPSSLPYKVFIIDEAHMLTKEAFNALLKTLEEPPSYAIFVLATTEIEKIPLTISSRTQQFQFRRVSLKQISEKLWKIAKEEKVKVTNEALELIASAAEGSFRDAESFFDQLISFHDAEIKLEDVEKMIGKIGFDKLSSLADSVLRGDKENTLQKLNNIEQAGYDIARFAKDLIQYFRRVAVLKFDPEMSKLLEREFIPEHLGKINLHAQIFFPQHLEFLKSLITAYGQMRYSQFPIIPLEVAIIEFLAKN